MKNKLLQWLAFVLLPLSAVACGGGGGDDEGNTLLLSAELTVVASNQSGSGTVGLNSYSNGEVTSYEVAGAGFVNNSNLLTYFAGCDSHPLLESDASNLPVGEAWTITGCIVGTSATTIHAQVLSTSSSVVAGAGTFADVVLINYDFVYQSDPGAQWYIVSNVQRYFKEGVGLVKAVVTYADGWVQTSTLQSYSVVGGAGLLPLALGNSWSYSGNWYSSTTLTETFSVTQAY